MRSSTSSSPIWKRTRRPARRSMCVAVRNVAQSNGIARLSKPPQEEPMPNSVSASRKACDGLVGHGLSTMLNRPDAPVKSRFQIAWPGSVSQRRVQHARDLGPRREPARDRRAPTARCSRSRTLHGAQAAQREEHVLRPGAEAPWRRRSRAGPSSSARWRRRGRAAGRNAPPRYLVPASIAMIDAVLVRREEQRRRPGIVHQHDSAVRMRDRGDRRDVLHLERQRARRLGEDRARVRPESASRCRRRCSGS